MLRQRYGFFGGRQARAGPLLKELRVWLPATLQSHIELRGLKPRV